MKTYSLRFAALSLIACGHLCGCNGGSIGGYVGQKLRCADEVPMDLVNTPSAWPAAAALPEDNVRQLASNLWSVRCSNFRQVAAEQTSEDYCWAACSQMVLRFNGISADQEEIVRDIKGAVGEGATGTGSVWDILRALAGPFRSATVTNGMGEYIVQDLATNWPVIIGLRGSRDDNVGHACVLTGAEISWYGQTPVFHRVTIFDPLPGVGQRSMDCDELQREIVFAVHLHTAGSMIGGSRSLGRRDE